MNEGICICSVVHLLRTVGIGVGSHVDSGERQSMHVRREHSAGRCPRYRSAELPRIIAER